MNKHEELVSGFIPDFVDATVHSKVDEERSKVVTRVSCRDNDSKLVTELVHNRHENITEHERDLIELQVKRTLCRFIESA